MKHQDKAPNNTNNSTVTETTKNFREETVDGFENALTKYIEEHQQPLVVEDIMELLRKPIIDNAKKNNIEVKEKGNEKEEHEEKKEITKLQIRLKESENRYNLASQGETNQARRANLLFRETEAQAKELSSLKQQMITKDNNIQQLNTQIAQVVGINQQLQQRIEQLEKQNTPQVPQQNTKNNVTQAENDTISQLQQRIRMLEGENKKLTDTIERKDNKIGLYREQLKEFEPSTKKITNSQVGKEQKKDEDTTRRWQNMVTNNSVFLEPQHVASVPLSLALIGLPEAQRSQCQLFIHKLGATNILSIKDIKGYPRIGFIFPNEQAAQKVVTEFHLGRSISPNRNNPSSAERIVFFDEHDIGTISLLSQLPFDFDKTYNFLEQQKQLEAQAKISPRGKSSLNI